MILRSTKIFNYIITAVIVLLAFPATAILASWNSLPSSTLYPVKRNLEKTALALLPDSALEMQLRFKLLDRRSHEANIAIIQQPSDDRPLEEIIFEAKDAQTIIMKLPPETKQQTSTQLIQKLNPSQLDNLKKTVDQSYVQNSSFHSQTQTQAQTLTQTQTQSQSQSQTSPTTPIPPETQQNLIVSIELTQEQINEIINNLQQQITPPPTQPNDPDPQTQPPQTTTPSDTPSTTPSDIPSDTNDTSDNDNKGKGKGKDKKDKD